MTAPTVELLLPLGDASSAGELTARRWQHLLAVVGIDARSAQRLAREFPSLAAVYAADEERLQRAVGPVVASRIRWFLDAPLDTGVTPVASTHAEAA